MRNPDFPSRSSDRYIGICMDLLRELQRRIEFQYTLYLAPDELYGVQNPNTGEWNGLIGEIVKGVSTVIRYAYS